jgi:hypothetical protein
VPDLRTVQPSVVSSVVNPPKPLSQLKQEMFERLPAAERLEIISDPKGRAATKLKKEARIAFFSEYSKSESLTALGIERGDHVGFFFETRNEQFEWVCPFIREGIVRNDLCLYIVSENTIPAVLSHLSDSGVETDGAQKDGALQLMTKEQSFYKYGLFDPETMISHLKELESYALSMGFSGLRASGEMGWAIDTPDALLTLRKYEAELHRNFGPKLTGLCQYDLTRIDDEIISEMVRIHPKIIARGRVITNRFTCDPDVVLAGGDF